VYTYVQIIYFTCIALIYFPVVFFYIYKVDCGYISMLLYVHEYVWDWNCLFCSRPRGEDHGGSTFQGCIWRGSD